MPAQRKAQKQSGRTTRAAEGGTVGAENSTGSSVRSGFAWIDTKSDASNYEVEVVEAPPGPDRSAGWTRCGASTPRSVKAPH